MTSRIPTTIFFLGVLLAGVSIYLAPVVSGTDPRVEMVEGDLPLSVFLGVAAIFLFVLGVFSYILARQIELSN